MQAAQIPISIFPFWYGNVRHDRGHYRPFLQPWRGDTAFIEVWKHQSADALVSEETAYMLFSLAKLSMSHPGEIWECGVYRGASSSLLAAARVTDRLCDKTRILRLFDTFSGMPEFREDMDTLAVKSLDNTSLQYVTDKLRNHENISFHPGFIPETFAGLESSVISFAHIDVDQYATTKECCSFIFPRLVPGGLIVIDDYGRPSTIGSRIAADEYFHAQGIDPVVLNTGQALVVR
jgi:predicted O-methyltransferase YrrM